MIRSCIGLTETRIRVGAKKKTGTTNRRFVPCRRFPEQDHNMRHFFRPTNLARIVEDSKDKALQIFNSPLVGSENPATHCGHLETGENSPTDSRKETELIQQPGRKQWGKTKSLKML